MLDRIPADKALRCASCGDRFVFTSGEQELFRFRGITADPTQCPNCVRGRLLSATAPPGLGKHADRA